MWKQIPVSDDKRYVLNLCQNAKGHRYCVVTEVGISAPDMVRQTVEVSPDMIRRNDWDEIQRLTLTDGGRFVLGAHGEWFTVEEAAVRAGDHDSVPWITPVPPRLALK